MHGYSISDRLHKKLKKISKKDKIFYEKILKKIEETINTKGPTNNPFLVSLYMLQ